MSQNGNSEKDWQPENIICRFCKKVPQKIFQCSRCRSVHYCSRKCQEKDWKRHQSECLDLKRKKLERVQLIVSRFQRCEEKSFSVRTTDTTSVHDLIVGLSKEMGIKTNSFISFRLNPSCLKPEYKHVAGEFDESFHKKKIWELNLEDMFSTIPYFEILDYSKQFTNEEEKREKREGEERKIHHHHKTKNESNNASEVVILNKKLAKEKEMNEYLNERIFTLERRCKRLQEEKRSFQQKIKEQEQKLSKQEEIKEEFKVLSTSTIDTLQLEKSDVTEMIEEKMEKVEEMKDQFSDYFHEMTTKMKKIQDNLKEMKIDWLKKNKQHKQKIFTMKKLIGMNDDEY